MSDSPFRNTEHVDTLRLRAFAELLEHAPDFGLSNHLTVLFQVNPPDGGSVAVRCGSARGEGASAEQALHAMLDEVRQRHAAVARPAAPLGEQSQPV